MALALLCLNVKENEFYSMTPKLLYRGLFMKNVNDMERLKSEWEQTRLSIYYNCEFKTPITYKQFCIQYLPLSWDPVEEPYEITDELKNQIFGTPKDNLVSTVVTDMSQLKGLL